MHARRICMSTPLRVCCVWPVCRTVTHRSALVCSACLLLQSELQHILAKPGMYIGSSKLDGEEGYWVCSGAGSGELKTRPIPAGSKDMELDYSSDEDDAEDAGDDEPAAPRMEYRKVRIVPGLYKLFDEILVNAADNKQRDNAKYTMDSQWRGRT